MRQRLILALWLVGEAPVAARPDFFELPPISYSQTASQDAVAKLSREVARGDWVVPPSSGKEFLRVVLEKLDVPIESQVLVFSKTSLQNSLIHRANPRALYFSMDTYVAWVPGGKVEVIIEDEKLGPVFYTIAPPRSDRPLRIERATDSCLQCHASSRTEGVPGMFIRSVFPDQKSHPVLSAGTSLVTDSTPLKDRWGGWYVTGTSGDPHLGNRWLSTRELDSQKFQPAVSALVNLDSLIDTSKYLQATSDIVALMVLEHQCSMHNLLTKAKMAYRKAAYFQKSYHDDDDLDGKGGLAWKVAENSAKEIVESLLFTSEVTLGGDGVEGGEFFPKVFSRRGVKTAKNKTLRSLRLYERIFKYRCSYMIYSKAFKGLPEQVKERVFHHLRLALSNDSKSHLSFREKKGIRQILTETLPGFKSESEHSAEGQ